ncbi:MAG: hypothetical protein J6V79_02735 [Bacilli bacterium]|nr:hypothetical protein [Bacilli bacterium]
MTTFDALPTDAIITIIIVSVLVLAGVVVLLYFSVFSKLSLKRQARDLCSRFEREHALLFGDVIAYVRRLETISTMNLVYVEEYATWSSAFKNVRDSMDALAQATSNSVKDLLTDRRFKELKNYLPSAKKTIGEYEEKVESLYKGLKDKFAVEENVSSLSLRCKESFRQVKQEFYLKSSDLSILTSSFDLLFKKVNDLLDEADSNIENARYEEAEAIYKNKIIPVVNRVRAVIKALPDICVQITNILPDKINSLSERYEQMIKDGYPLNHIMLKKTIPDMNDELAAIVAQVKTLNVQGVQEKFDDIRARIDKYQQQFDDEIAARATFEADSFKTSSKETETQNNYLNLVHALPKIKSIYLLDEEDQNKLNEIQRSINAAATSKRNLDTFIHSGTKQPFTILLSRMNALKEQSKDASDQINEFQAYLRSLKVDCEKAAKSLDTYNESIRDAEAKVREMNLPSMTAKYTPLFEEASNLLGDLYTSLKTTPIDVKKVNAVYDELTSKCESLLGSLKSDSASLESAEQAVVYANRFRSNDSNNDATLSQAETLFLDGYFSEADSIAKTVSGSNNEHFFRRSK